MKCLSTQFIALLLLFGLLLGDQIAVAQNSFPAQIPMKITVNNADGVDFKIDALRANFGPYVNFTEITADAARVTDGVTEPADNDTWTPVGLYGCEELTNPAELEGKIALISRGSCEFGVKIKNAEDAGAVAAIVMNRAPLGLTVGTHTDGLVWMGAGAVGDSTNIPGLFISYEDRLVLESVLGNEGSLNLTIEHYWMYDGTAAYAYSTPESQIRPLDSIQLVVANRDTFEMIDFMFTATVTDPDGTMTELTTTVDTIPALNTDGTSPEYQVFFDSYTPTVAGEYSVVFTAISPTGDHPLDEESLEVNFEISDNEVFAMDDGSIDYENGFILNPNAYIDAAFLSFNIGAFYRTGSSGGTAISGAFAIANPLDLTPGLNFNLELYDADPDGDFNLDNDLDGTIDDTDVFTSLVGSTTYTLDGSEAANTPIVVEFGDPITLEGDKIYLLMLRHDGLLDDNFSPPSYSIGGDANTASYGTVVELARPGDDTYELEYDGFEWWNDDTPTLPHGGMQPVLRLLLDGFVGTEDIGLLAEAKIGIAPNPVSENLQLRLNLDQTADEVQIGVLDMLGKVVGTYELANVRETTYTIPVKNLSAGTYFLSVITPEGYRSKKFVVVK